MADPNTYGIASNGIMQGTIAGKQSRINADVERVLTIVRSINGARDRAAKHASALGYFSEDPATGNEGKVQPISNNLQNALSELDRAVANLHSELNLFD